jgi:hypothetical protein
LEAAAGSGWAAEEGLGWEEAVGWGWAVEAAAGWDWAEVGRVAVAAGWAECCSQRR